MLRNVVTTHAVVSQGHITPVGLFPFHPLVHGVVEVLQTPDLRLQQRGEGRHGDPRRLQRCCRREELLGRHNTLMMGRQARQTGQGGKSSGREQPRGQHPGGHEARWHEAGGKQTGWHHAWSHKARGHQAWGH